MSTDANNPMFVDLQKRVNRVEDELRVIIKDAAQAKTDQAVMGRDIAHIRETTDKVTAGINRILWAIGLSVVGTVTTVIMSGGFKVG